MKTSNFNSKKSNTNSEAKLVQLDPNSKKQFAAVDLWKIQKQRKMIFRRSA